MQDSSNNHLTEISNHMIQSKYPDGTLVAINIDHITFAEYNPGPEGGDATLTINFVGHRQTTTLRGKEAYDVWLIINRQAPSNLTT